MGLDMFAFAHKSEDLAGDEKPIEIAYWRKFNALHGWMEDLYKGRGNAAVFNCVELPLLKEDLDRLEDDVKNKRLTERQGFFWGNYPPDDEDYESVLVFIRKARDYMNNGYDIYYDSWW